MIFSILIACSITITTLIAGQSAQPANPAATQSKAAADKPPVEILSHKISAEHYAILDQPSSIAPQMTADAGGIPRLMHEPNRDQHNFDVPPDPNRSQVPNGDRRDFGRVRTYTRTIDNARLVEVVVKNTGARPIKVVEWDFAFPRYVNGRFLRRYDVTTKANINPGGKKTLKYRLPPGAKRCEVSSVSSGRVRPGAVTRIEMVCAKGFQYPQLVSLNQDMISIKRIEYVNGSVWLRP